MTKPELIRVVACKLPKVNVNDIDRVINATLDVIRDELTVGGEVNLIGFGKFSVKHRAARKGTNPRTGEAIDLPASRLPYFQAGRALKQAVNHD